MKKLIQDIKSNGIESAYVDSPYDEGKLDLESNGYSIISLEENAMIRIEEGINSEISSNGNWVREGVIYVPNKGIFLTKHSPIITNSKEATECHIRGREFYLSAEQVERSLDGAVMLDGKNIPTNRFADNEITVYAFGNNAKAYGEFLKEKGIEEMPVHLFSFNEKSFARQVWFRNLEGGSTLGCGNYGLSRNSRVRGIKYKLQGQK